MSSQADQQPSGVPDALVQELLRRHGLPPDARVNVTVHTTRTLVKPDGTHLVLEQGSGSVRARSRRAPTWACVLFTIIGFVQMTYGLWASHSDALATPLLHGSSTCQIGHLLSDATGDASVVASPFDPCRIERVVIIKRYTTTSRHSRYFHITTLTPTGRRDDISLVGHAGIQLWNRVQPTERVALQRFVRPGYHLTNDVMAVGDSVGTGLSRVNPDSNYQDNLVNILMGAVLFVSGLALFAKTNAASDA